MSQKKFFIAILVASVLGAALAVGGYHLFSDKEVKYKTIEQKKDYVLSNYTRSSSKEDTVPLKVNERFVSAASRVRPAVVHIKTVHKGGSGGPHRNPLEDQLREFFGPGFPDERFRQREPQPKQGTGSGVIVTKDGHIVTNNHVIKGADEIEVVMNNRRSFQAEVVGTDPTTDLALLKVDASGLPTVRFGNSEHLKIGEWVLAVGNPFNLSSTVTAGIVSAKARNINILRRKTNLAIESFIQTDAAVNPGNSGGALVNMEGRLVGINTAIASPTGTYAGYAFAVPSIIAKKVVNDLLEYGTVQRALLGVSIRDVTSKLKEEKGLESVRGIYVAQVNEGSAAQEAGLKEGDVIVAVDGEKVENSSQLQAEIALHRPGDKVKVTYVRDGEEYTVETELKNKMGNTEIVKKEDQASVSTMGATLESVDEEKLKKLGVKNGVQVTSLKKDSKLRQIGIKEGFIIVSVDKQSVKGPNDVVSLLNQAEDGVLIAGVYPDGTRAYYGLGVN